MEFWSKEGMEAKRRREMTLVKLEVGSTRRGPSAFAGGSAQMVSCESAGAPTNWVLFASSGTKTNGRDCEANTEDACKEADSTGRNSANNK
jgi:hypothetical protein